MPEWAAGTIVGVVTIMGAGILKMLFTIQRSLGEIVANTKANGDAIDDLQNWRLNVEQRRAIITSPRMQRDTY